MTHRLPRLTQDTGGPASMTVRNYKKSGDSFLNFVVSLPLHEDCGKVVYHAAILHALPE